MKTRKIFMFFMIIGILLTNSSFAIAQSSNGYHPQGIFFNLQFFMKITLNENITSKPIPPGEMRQIPVTVYYAIVHGLFGRIILRILQGRLFPIHVSVEESPEWCEAWFSTEDAIGVIDPDSTRTQSFSLNIYVDQDAPPNILGIVKCRCTIDNITGPFNKFTVVNGYQSVATFAFTTFS